MKINTRRNSATVTFRKNCLALLVGIAITSSVSAQRPMTTAKYAIPSGDLIQVVNEISRTSGLQIVYDIDSLRGLKSIEVSGNLTPQQALDKALNGTGLTWTLVNPTTVSIRKKESTPKAPVASPPTTTASPSAGEATSVGSANEHISTLPDILVTGSRSINADIERTEDDIQPYVVFSREDLDLSQASNIEEFLNTRLPMNQSKGTMSRNTPEGDAGNRSSFNLRGLGANQTLILINGRRAPGVSTLLTGDLGQPDLNGIPLAAIERIEVLPTTASGIYGGGATGGVINIVLRKDYVGSEVRLSYDNTFDTDSARRRIDVSSGFALESGKTNVMVSGSYADGNDILVRDRDFALRGRQLLQANDPAQLAYWTVLGRQTNVFGFSDLVLDDGTSLGSPYATVPVGYAGGDGGLGLVAGAGVTDIGIPDTIAGGRQSLSAVPTTRNFSLAVRREFSDSIDGYLDYGVYRNEGETKWAGFGATVYLGGDAPGNPFNDTVAISIPLYNKELEQSSTAISETERLNAGFTFKLPANWSGGLDFTRNVSTNTTQQAPDTLDIWAMTTDIESGKLNVFRDLALYPLDLSPYMTGSLSGYGPGKGTLTEYAFRVGGPLFRLPAGEVRLTALASSRREEAGDALSLYRDSSGTSYRYLPSRHQDIRSFYVETTAPLVAANQEVPFVYSLETQASFRRDEYRTVSVPSTSRLYLDTPSSPIPPYSYDTSKTASNDFTLGFKYEPVEDVALRASVGSGFLPPSLAQISYQQFLGAQYVRDPKRGNVLRFTPNILMSFGGSADVKPERSQSFSAGLIFTPGFAPGLRMSADYTRIKKTDEITTLSAQQILDLEDSLPGRVVRGSNLPGDPAGYAGVITELDLTLFNTASSKVEAWDFQAEYEHSLDNWGDIQFYGVATLQSALESQTISTSPVVDRVGYSDGPLKWRGNAGVVWRMGGWTTSLNTQWYDGYLVYPSNASSWTQDALTRGQGSSRVGSQAYTDISARYTFNGGRLDGMWISVGVRNVFDTSPPILATADSRGGYSTYGDPRGRTYVLSLQKSF